MQLVFIRSLLADCSRERPAKLSSLLFQWRTTLSKLIYASVTFAFAGLAVFAPAVNAQQIYFNDFANPADPLTEWSNKVTTTSPSGERFLGRFSSNNSTLTLPTLPGIQSVTLSLDFYAIDSWDGQGPSAGPDTWGVGVVGGPALLQNTFNNMEGLSPWGPQGQSFGGQGQPNGTYLPRTGASANNTLGFQSGQFWGSRDSTYHLTFTFPYTASSLSLNFYDLGLQGLSDESWGLDNVRVGVFVPTADVPEPGTVALLSGLLASGGLFVRRRRAF